MRLIAIKIFNRPAALLNMRYQPRNNNVDGYVCSEASNGSAVDSVSCETSDVTS